ncbi:ATP-binding protein [uncultured Enorma sp.]|jgi:predicted AAA+ superfamily ATPase|uniref:ATP-binding protein n=1 Tax=uncultured Enorma sp. TaxID=1714346 RepID=UPI0025DC66C3|nr:ATP-binding protein [uncultured Enorma sp.]
MYQRELSYRLAKRLREPRHFMQIVMGPRQTGKTTAIQQALQQVGLPYHVASADASEQSPAWIEVEWRQARNAAMRGQAILVLDEIQKVPEWSNTVKALWDEDSWNGTPLTVVLSGSSSLLLAEGLTESLAGRFELLRSTHWSFSEMHDAFGYTLDDYLHFGGYPGAASLCQDELRWRSYMRDSIIETTISRDILQMEHVRKPALMRALFDLGAQYSAQELSYRKILGQLDDKGNTDTVKHYLTLLEGAGIMSGLQKYHGKQVVSRASSPRLMVHDPSLMTASWRGSGNLLHDPALRGHLVETAVGSTLIARSQLENFELYWWREGNLEVDFVLKRGDDMIAIEVKSGRIKKSGIGEFCKLYKTARPIVVGARNAPLDAFLAGEIPLF